MEISETLLCASAAEWRAWLEAHHRTKAEIWLISFKKEARRASARGAAAEPEPERPASISYEAALDEALCFGWIDNLVRRIDEARYATRWCPRRPRGNWTAANRAHARRLFAAGRMTEAGLASLPPDLRAELGPAPDTMDQS